MLVLLCCASASLLSGPARASAEPSAPASTRPSGPLDRGKRMLTAAEVMRDFTFWQPAVRECYVKHASKQRTATGRFQLELIIRPTGSVMKLGVVAPGVKGNGLDRCIQKSAKDWHFGQAPGHTTTVIPMLLLKTYAPGAGPTKR